MAIYKSYQKFILNKWTHIFHLNLYGVRQALLSTLCPTYALSISIIEMF